MGAVEALPAQERAKFDGLGAAVGGLKNAELLAVGEGPAGGPVSGPRRTDLDGQEGVWDRICHDKSPFRPDL